MPIPLVERLLPSLPPRLRGLRANKRAEVRPPVPHDRARPWRARIASWLASGLGDGASSLSLPDTDSASATALIAAKNAFRTALLDIDSNPVQGCREHIRAARSLHELWHLRAEVFNLVARQRDQIEAGHRLDRLDRHFPSRVRRSAAANAAPAHVDSSLLPL